MWYSKYGGSKMNIKGLSGFPVFFSSMTSITNLSLFSLNGFLYVLVVSIHLHPQFLFRLWFSTGPRELRRLVSPVSTVSDTVLL